jgi:hypothetical protein
VLRVAVDPPRVDDDIDFGNGVEHHLLGLQLLRAPECSDAPITAHRRRRAALDRLTPVEFETIMTTLASQAA